MATIVVEKSSRSLRKTEKIAPRVARPTFTALDRFRSKRVGLLVTVELDRDTDDFGHLVGKKIVVDGKMENLGAAYTRVITGTWKAGTKVGNFKVVRN